jgi:hypothetical protein
VTQIGKYRWAIWLGWFLTTFGTGLMVYLNVGTNVASWIFLNLIGGFGIGILYPALSYAIQASSSNEDMAYAATLFGFFRVLGETLGVAVGGSIFQNQVQRKMMAYPLLASHAQEYSRNASGLVQIIKAMADSDPAKAMLKQAYADALKVVWATTCALSAVAFIVSFLTQELSLDRALETEQGWKAGNGEEKKEEDAEAEVEKGNVGA